MPSSIIPANANSFDIIKASLTGSVAVVFSKTRGSGYDAGVNFAKQAEKYDETTIGSTLFHFAVFGRTREQAAIALALIRNMRSVKSLQIIAGGKLLQESSNTEAVLSCYLDSAALDDPRAHCVEMIHDSHLVDRFLSSPDSSSLVVSLDIEFLRRSNRTERLVAFPCRYLRWQRGFKFQPGHPSSPKAQLQAASVRCGCDWCPNFKPEETAWP